MAKNRNNKFNLSLLIAGIILIVLSQILFFSLPNSLWVQAHAPDLFGIGGAIFIIPLMRWLLNLFD